MPWIVRDAPFDWTLREAGRRRELVNETLDRVARRLTEEGIPYAVIGGMALVAHGFVRFTNDVDLLTTREGLDRIHQRLVGRGYRPAFEGSRKKLRDTQTGIDVEFIITGEFPGDGKPKPVVFPDPSEASVERDGRQIIELKKLIELKLASGLTAEHRKHQDLGDVEKIISALSPPRDLADQLDPSVRDEYLRMWDAAANATGPDKE
jgi:hypothetical protein